MQNLASQPIVAQLHAKIKTLAAECIDRGVDPLLAVVLVGSNPASLTYVQMKEKAALELGIILSIYHIEETAPFSEIEATIHFLAQDPEVHGLIVQLPLPDAFPTAQVDALLAGIPSSKDVDGLSGEWKNAHLPEPNLAAFLHPHAPLLPPMIGSVISLLDYYQYPPKNKEVVLVGNGRLVGQPLAYYLQSQKIAVDVVDEETPKILEHTQKADILITGTGEKDLITYQWVKEGVVVINTSGDVHVESVSQVAEALSPTIGGVGPLTVAWLLYNTVAAARKELNG